MTECCYRLAGSPTSEPVRRGEPALPQKSATTRSPHAQLQAAGLRHSLTKAIALRTSVSPGGGVGEVFFRRGLASRRSFGDDVVFVVKLSSQ